MKKFINEPDQVVREALVGMALAHPDLRVDLDSQLVVRGDAPVTGKVGLVSGGGSGHEPLHAGFVGAGMLDAACAGEIFTSPVPDQIVAATHAVDGGAGVLHIVKNYTGDVLNFQMAAELAGDDGVPVRTVLVDDDVAVQDSTYTAGRRGTGATLIVEKVAGALAERGASLDEVAAVAEKVNARSASFAVALAAGTTPAAGRPGFDLEHDEMEVGVGIHGEPGRQRAKVVPAAQIVALALDAIWSAQPPVEGEPVIVLVNGLGGTPMIELYLLLGEVGAALTARGVPIARSLVGNYVTSLDMAGASLTVCRADEEIVRLWDAPVRTPRIALGVLSMVDGDLIRRWFAAISAAMDEHADELTRLDTAIGDGDQGTNLRRGFQAVAQALDALESESPGDLLVKAGGTLISKVGGASGPLYGSAFRAVGKALPVPADTGELVEALQSGLDALQKLGGAQPGDKTMVDAWSPAIEAMRVALDGGADLASTCAAGASAADAGAVATRQFQARKGRASYLGERSIGHQDAGATASALIFQALAVVTAA